MNARHLALRPYQREAIDAVTAAWADGVKRPVGWDTGEFRLCLSCADVHRPGQMTDRAGWRPIPGTLERECDWCGKSLEREASDG